MEGVKDFVLKVVSDAGPNPCPPIVVGVGVGGTFDKVALLAKKALMRSVDERNPDEFYASLEQELLEKINALGIGPQGFGGRTTALAVNIEKMPTHIAGLPVAARGAADKETVFVDEGDGEAVYLRLADDLDFIVAKALAELRV